MRQQLCLVVLVFLYDEVCWTLNGLWFSQWQVRTLRCWETGLSKTGAKAAQRQISFMFFMWPPSCVRNRNTGQPHTKSRAGRARHELDKLKPLLETVIQTFYQWLIVRLTFYIGRGTTHVNLRGQNHVTFSSQSANFRRYVTGSVALTDITNTDIFCTVTRA